MHIQLPPEQRKRRDLENAHALLRISRQLRATRKAGLYDPEAVQCAVGVWLIQAGVLYLLLGVFLDALYGLLERAGVLRAIFNFMGW